MSSDADSALSTSELAERIKALKARNTFAAPPSISALAVSLRRSLSLGESAVRWNIEQPNCATYLAPS